MAETKANTETVEQSTSAQAANSVINIEYVKKKKKGRKKYSRSLKGIQIWEDGLSKASLTLSKGISSGISSYRKGRNKSARKRKDGAIVDLVPNLAKGLGEAMRKSSNAPLQLAQSRNTKRRRKRIKGAVRLLNLSRRF